MRIKPFFSPAKRAELYAAALNSRGEFRYPCPPMCFAWLYDRQPDDPKAILLLANISQHGLAVFATTPLKLDSIIDIHIPSLAARRPKISCQVLHRSAQPIGDWLIGCRILDQPLSEEELELCLFLDDADTYPDR